MNPEPTASVVSLRFLARGISLALNDQHQPHCHVTVVPFVSRELWCGTPPEVTRVRTWITGYHGSPLCRAVAATKGAGGSTVRADRGRGHLWLEYIARFFAIARRQHRWHDRGASTQGDANWSTV